MILYFSKDKTIQLKQFILQIIKYFQPNIQEQFNQFIKNIEKGFCELELYNNIYSILNNYSNFIKSENKVIIETTKAKKAIKKNIEIDNKKIIDLINELRIQFLIKYYIDNLENNMFIRDNKNEREI